MSSPYPTNFNVPDDAKDAYKYLSEYAVNNPIFGEIFGQANQGLTPEAHSAMRTEATSGLNDRYEQVARSLRTNLLRQGAIGTNLPPDTGAVINSFAPLQSELANARSKATRDTILANESMRTTNRTQAGQTMANALGLSSQAINGLSGLESESTRNILLASLLGTGVNALTNPEVLKSLGSLVGKIPGLSSLLPGGTGAVGTAAGIPQVGAAANTANIGAAIPGLDTVGPALAGPTAGAAVAPPATGGGALAGIGAVAIPAALAAGGALLAWQGIKANHAHPVADTWVQDRQNPFDQIMSQTTDPAERKALATDYLADVQRWLQTGDQRQYIVAVQALNTFKERYGDPSQFGINVSIQTVDESRLRSWYDIFSPNYGANAGWGF